MKGTAFRPATIPLFRSSCVDSFPEGISRHGNRLWMGLVRPGELLGFEVRHTETKASYGVESMVDNVAIHMHANAGE